MIRLLMPLAVVVLGAGLVHAKRYYVSPDGSDMNPGTLSRPFATLKRAAVAARAGDTCYLRAGIYREVLRPVRSGEKGRPITFEAYRGEKAVISGADLLTGWTPDGNGAFAAAMAWTLRHGDQVFADGEMLCEARWPNAGGNVLFRPVRAIAQGGSPHTLVCDRIPGPDGSWKGAELWCAGGSAWICWTANVTAYDAGGHALTFDKNRDRWYTPRKGSKFVLRGLRRCLDAPGEWFLDASARRLLVIPPVGVDLRKTRVEAKRRPDAIDLSGLSHITVKGIRIAAAGVRTDDDSSHIVLQGLHGRYVAHSYSRSVSSSAGILVRGRDNLVLSCDFGYSSASVLSTEGQGHRVINCHIHHGGYDGLWRGTVRLQGRRIVFSHNTVRHAGRDLINTHGLTESLLQYNDVSDAGWLTSDLGMFYGHNTDFANTEFHHNLVHDNHARHCAMGIYFDHLSHNAIVHHNVIWNVGMDPIRFNNPGYGNLVFNNSCYRTGSTTTFDHIRRNDLFASRYFNNIFNKPVKLPEHVAAENNLVAADPPYRDPGGLDFRLRPDAKQDVGAFAPTNRAWAAGCDLAKPPAPLPTYSRPHIGWMNAMKNACFELGTLESWEKDTPSQAVLVPGNGWGAGLGVGVKKKEKHPTGTSKYELQLGPGPGGVSQRVTGLSPNRTYRLSAWLRVSDAKESVVLGVERAGEPDVSVGSSSTQWQRKSVEFTTGATETEVTVTVRKPAGGRGLAWADNFTLPLTPPTP